MAMHVRTGSRMSTYPRSCVLVHKAGLKSKLSLLTAQTNFRGESEWAEGAALLDVTYQLRRGREREGGRIRRRGWGCKSGTGHIPLKQMSSREDLVPDRGAAGALLGAHSSRRPRPPALGGHPSVRARARPWDGCPGCVCFAASDVI